MSYLCGVHNPHWFASIRISGKLTHRPFQKESHHISVVFSLLSRSAGDRYSDYVCAFRINAQFGGAKIMGKIILTAFLFPLLLLFAPADVQSGRNSPSNTEEGSGTLQKMIVENGSVTMHLDLNGLNGSSSLVARPVTLQF